MKNYSLWGSSAGGHLAASFGTDSMGYKKYGIPKPGAIILCYPVITMYQQAHAGSLRYLLGENPSAQMLEQASVERQITADYPPTFVWHGLADQDVNPDNSKLLADALAEKGVTHRYLTFSDVGHGVSFACDLQHSKNY